MAVAASGPLLVQSSTPVLGGGVDAAVAFCDSGAPTVGRPADDRTAAVADHHPEIAETLGL